MEKFYEKKENNCSPWGGGHLDKILSVVIVVFVVTLSIGYSAFNTSLNITGVVSKIRIQKDIRVTGLLYSSGTGSGLSTYEEYGTSSLLMGVKLPNQTSTVTYKVSVTNLGNTEMGIFSIDNLPSNLTYSINGYNLKDKICDDSGKCSLGITKDFYITIGYASNGFNSSTTEYSLKLNVNFKPMYKVTYEGITNNNYPTSIMENDTLDVTFAGTLMKAVLVYIDEVSLDEISYTYESNHLTIPNVTGNVKVLYLEKAYLKYLGEGLYFKDGEYTDLIQNVSLVNYVDTSQAVKEYDLGEISGSITGWLNSNSNGMYDLYIGSDFDIYSKDFSEAFREMSNVSTIIFENYNNSENEYLIYTFNNVGDNITITGLESFDTSKVIVMSGLFEQSRSSSATFNIGDISSWDTSKVIDMRYMFTGAGEKSNTFEIGDISGWDTSNVTSVEGMFEYAGYSATTFNIGDLSDWNTSKVIDMSRMFNNAGYNATIFDIGDLSNWNTSNVTNMLQMFDYAGYKATTFDLGNLGNWDTSKVTNMSYMFDYAGYNATTFNIGDLSNWNTSKVTNMAFMFNQTGPEATVFNIGDLGKWNTSNVTNMDSMFFWAGYNATYTQNLSGWDVSKVTNHDEFYSGNELKITPPTWVS